MIETLDAEQVAVVHPCQPDLGYLRSRPALDAGERGMSLTNALGTSVRGIDVGAGLGNMLLARPYNHMRARLIGAYHDGRAGSN